eukprot:7441714-Pyramimonas_sp.AAC.1
MKYYYKVYKVRKVYKRQLSWLASAIAPKATANRRSESAIVIFRYDGARSKSGGEQNSSAVAGVKGLASGMVRGEPFASRLTSYLAHN